MVAILKKPVTYYLRSIYASLSLSEVKFPTFHLKLNGEAPCKGLFFTCSWDYSWSQHHQ